MNTVAIIQARMSSSRLPGKVLAPIEGQPMLQHVVERAAQAKSLDSIAIATSDNAADDPIVEFCKESGTAYFRGSLDDVLDRYYQAAKYFGADVIIRLTADCPLLDPGVIDRVVNFFREGDFDYAANVIECTYPDGLDTEVFRRQALSQAWSEAQLKSEREHVTPYIRNHPELFRLGSLRHSEDLSALRWTVDEPNDLKFVRAIYERLGSATFSMEDVLTLLREHPELGEVNRGIGRNEGYLKSLREDIVSRQAEAK